MREIVSISLGPSSEDYELTLSFRGDDFHVRRFGVNGRDERAMALLRHWDGRADAIGLGMVKDHYTVGTHRFVDKDTARLLDAVKSIPATTGARLRTLLSEWAVRHVQSELGHYFDNARMLFLSGMMNWRLAQTLSEYTENLSFADPAIQLGMPKLLSSLGALERYAAVVGRAERRTPPVVLEALQSSVEPVTRRAIGHALTDATMLVAPFHLLERYALGALRRKVVLTSAVSDERLELLRQENVDAVIDLSVQAFPRVVGLNVLEAVILASVGTRGEDALDDDFLEVFAESNLTPRVLYPSG
ncbi:MAG: dehydrogenase, partial [Polyangiaceae bacterium]|nr:dehydrogenase [Polyangiaceae bacterium]